MNQFDEKIFYNYNNYNFTKKKSNNQFEFITV